MIELNVLNQRYPCRTKDYLWYREIRQTVIMILEEHRTLAEIKRLSEEENLYNAVSPSRANEIRTVVARRIQSVNESFLCVFLEQDTQTQKVLSVIMVMLTDRMFFEFMDQVYREKLITNCHYLHDSDMIGFIHSVQNQETNASKLQINIKGSRFDFGRWYKAQNHKADYKARSERFPYFRGNWPNRKNPGR